jgi:hypothetical protein
METGYKAFTRKVYQSLNLESSGFDVEVELTAKILKNGYKIFEVPIKTKPRDYTEGKKITYLDGIKAVLLLFYYKMHNSKQRSGVASTQNTQNKL